MSINTTRIVSCTSGCSTVEQIVNTPTLLDGVGVYNITLSGCTSYNFTPTCLTENGTVIQPEGTVTLKDEAGEVLLDALGNTAVYTLEQYGAKNISADQNQCDGRVEIAPLYMEVELTQGQVLIEGQDCDEYIIEVQADFCGDLTSLGYVASVLYYNPLGGLGLGDADINGDESKVIGVAEDGLTIQINDLATQGDIASMNVTPSLVIDPANDGIIIDLYLFGVKTVGNNVYLLDASNIYKYDYTTGSLLDQVNYVNALGVAQSSINDISVTADETWLYYQSSNDSTFNTVDMSNGLGNITTISSTINLPTVIPGYVPSGQTSFDINDEGTIIYHSGYSSTAVQGNTYNDGAIANTIITTVGVLDDLSLVSEIDAAAINTNFPEMYSQEITVSRDGKSIYVSHDNGSADSYIISQYSMSC